MLDVTTVGHGAADPRASEQAVKRFGVTEPELQFRSVVMLALATQILSREQAPGLPSELVEVEQRLARLRGTFQWFTTAGAWRSSGVGRSPSCAPFG